MADTEAMTGTQTAPADKGRVIADQRVSRGTVLLVLAIAISALFIRMIQGFVMALFLAAVIAALAYPTYNKLLAKLRGRKPAAAALTVLLGILLVLLPLLWLVGVLAQQAVEISTTAEPWIEKQLEDSAGLTKQLEGVPGLAQLAPYKDNILAKAGQLGASAASWAVSSLAASTAGTAKSFLLLFVMFYGIFFFLQQGRDILARTIRYIPLPPADTHRMLDTFTSVTRATLKGTVVIGIVQGGLAGAAFAVAGIPGALFWSVVIAILSLVPGIGPAVVYVPAIAFLALQGHYATAVAVGVWCFGVVSTIDNVLRPRLVGQDTKMPDLLVLLGTLGGLALFGAPGVVAGPIVAALFLTVWELYGSAVDDVRASAE
jgi:predicted PurR-regulated permease PerM